MKGILRLPLVPWALSWLGTGYVTLIHLTVRYDQTVHESVRQRWDAGLPIIYAFWHRYQASACVIGGWTRSAFLVSPSRDGDILAGIARRAGGYPVRGSSSRGGGAAFRDLVRLIAGGRSAAITPDGPRGPHGTVHPGVVALAKTTGIPISPVGFGVSRCFETNSWDHFVVPLPFAHGQVVFGELLGVGPDTDEQAAGTLLGERIHEVSAQAEAAVGRSYARTLPERRKRTNRS